MRNINMITKEMVHAAELTARELVSENANCFDTIVWTTDMNETVRQIVSKYGCSYESAIILYEYLDAQPRHTETECNSFWADVRGTFGFTGKGTVGVMTTSHIADAIGLDEEATEAWLYDCMSYGITERQNGAWVI